MTACAICGSDLHLFNGIMPVMHGGDVMGHETMGEVIEVGKDNTKLKVGDRVVAGVLTRLVTPIINMAKSAGSLVAALVAAVVAANVATADQYLSIVLPGRMFKGVFETRGLAPPVLSRTIGATGTPTSALVPWNSWGAYMSSTLGISTIHYFPYAVFNFAGPLLAIVAAFAGIRMLR